MHLVKPELHTGKILVGGLLLTDEEALALSEQLRLTVEARDKARFLSRVRAHRLIGSAE